MSLIIAGQINDTNEIINKQPARGDDRSRNIKNIKGDDRSEMFENKTRTDVFGNGTG